MKDLKRFFLKERLSGYVTQLIQTRKKLALSKIRDPGVGATGSCFGGICRVGSGESMCAGISAPVQYDGSQCAPDKVQVTGTAHESCKRSVRQCATGEQFI